VRGAAAAGPLAAFAAALLLGGPLPVRAGSEAPAAQPGPGPLEHLLPLAESTDPDMRLRARRRIRHLALTFLHERAPADMRLVPGTIEITATSVRCKGGFYLAVHEVTLGEFRAWAGNAGLDAAHWEEGDDALPVANVSLREARAYASALGARLPTEDELLLVGRGGGLLRYPWGDRFEAFRANSREAGRGAPAPVGSCEAGLSVHGFADLLGNVAEWTTTLGGRNDFYAIVGGSYRVYGKRGVDRTYQLADTARLPDVGFRLAKSLPSLAGLASG